MRLWQGTAVLAVRRTVRSLGYRGDRPAIVALSVVLLLVVLSVGLTVTMPTAFDSEGQDALLLEALVPTFVVLVLYAVAGPVLLLAESTRGHGSALERVLESLPVRRRTVRLHVWVPPVLVSLGFVLLLVPPAVATLVAVGLAPITAAAVVLAVISVAGAVAACLLLLTRLVLRGGRWSAAHYPTALLAFMLTIVGSVVSMLDPRPGLTTLDRVLVLPVLLRTIQVEGPVDLGTVAVLALGGGAVGIAAAVGAGSLVGRARSVEVVLRWPIGTRPHLFVGELVHTLRRAGLVTNLAGVVVVGVGVVLLLMRIDLALLDAMITPALMVVPFLAGVTSRTVRSMYPLNNPPPQLVGVGRPGWVWRMTGVGGVVFAIGLSPLLLVLTRPDLAAVVDWPRLLLVSGAALTVALLLSWASPGSADDNVGQVIGTLVYLLVVSVVSWGLDALGTGPSAVAVVLGLFVVSLVVGLNLERRRWRPPTHRLRTRPSTKQEAKIDV